ncbi:MAG: FmdE family protein, partial [Planctomycetota bacterium]
AVVLVAAAALISFARAQDNKPQDGKPQDNKPPENKSHEQEKKLLDQQPLNSRPSQRLSFADPPKDWKAHPKESKPFLVDFDLPSAEGDESPRVNVLFFPIGFDEYRAKILGSWKTAKGDALKLDDQKVETLAEGELKLRLVEQAGTYTHKSAAPKTGFTLLAVHIRSKGEQWTAWLIGPDKSVARNKDAYLAWVKTARIEEDTDAIRDVRFVHGAPAHGVPGPWALTAHRIGKDALRRFGITRDRAWEVVVTHRAPKEVRYTCMLDGFIAATGASPGKLNLLHEAVAKEDDLETAILHKPTRKVLTYKLVKSFRDRIRDVEYAGFPEAAKMLDGLKDEEVFEVAESVTEK